MEAATRIYAYKIREGQETNVALFIDEVLNEYEKNPEKAEEQRQVLSSKPVAIMVLPNMKGVVLAEARNPRALEYILAGHRHYRGRIFGTIRFEEIEPLMKPKSVAEILGVGDEIEVVSGPLRGSRGKVLKVDKIKTEVTFQPDEVAVPMPMTISIDAVKLISQKGAEIKNG